MTIAQFIVAYSVCWWLVLFMVLPHGAQASANPAPGHVPSAPAKPRLKRKFALTTLLAIIPTITIYFISTAALAEDTIYHVGGGCEPLETYSSSADVRVRDGYGTGGKKVASANLEKSTILGDMDHVDIPFRIPSKNYVNDSKYNVDFSDSEINIGKLRVGMNDSTTLNGHSINSGDVFSNDCSSKKDW